MGTVHSFYSNFLLWPDWIIDYIFPSTVILLSHLWLLVPGMEDIESNQYLGTGECLVHWDRSIGMKMMMRAMSFALRLQSKTVLKLDTLRDTSLGHGIEDQYYRCTFQRY